MARSQMPRAGARARVVAVLRDYALPGKARPHDSFEKLIPCGNRVEFARNTRGTDSFPRGEARLGKMKWSEAGEHRGWKRVERYEDREVKAICNTSANWHVPWAKCGYLTGFLLTGAQRPPEVRSIFIRAASYRGNVRATSPLPIDFQSGRAGFSLAMCTAKRFNLKHLGWMWCSFIIHARSIFNFFLSMQRE